MILHEIAQCVFSALRAQKTFDGKQMEKVQDGLNYNGKCYISNSACYDDARAVADLVETRFPNLNGHVEINNIGTTIGSHPGPGTVALSEQLVCDPFWPMKAELGREKEIRKHYCLKN